MARAPRAIGTIEGEEVLETVLESETGVTVSVMTYGAAIRDWQVPVDGTRRSVVLGFDAVADYPDHSPYFGAIAGRVANRIAGAVFDLAGSHYVLNANAGPNQLHGGSRGFGKRLWRMEAHENEEAVTLRLTSPDGDMGYPGNLEARVVYRLTGNRLEIDFGAEADAVTPVNIVQHNYFNLMGRGDVLDHELWLAANAYTVVDADSIPSGAIEPVEGTRFNFREPATMRKDNGDPVYIDHNLVLDTGLGFDAPVARLVAPDKSLALALYTDQPGLQVYNGWKIDLDRPGLHGTPYPKFAGLCLEDQKFPDGVHHPHFPSTIIGPDTPYTHRCAIEIG